MLPFESGQAEIIEIQGNTLKLIPPPGDKSFEPREFIFTDIAGQKSNNQQCFEKICKNMCDAVLEGYNGVLMAYGQTGCGKTYTMLGKPDRNVLGLIPRCLKYFFDNDKTDEVTLSVVEAYSRNVMKIELFDLFLKHNQNEDWSKKKGSTTLDVGKCTRIKLKDYSHGHAKVVEAQTASHVAPTGKNPESSRGHTMYLVKVTQKVSGTEIIDPATFVFVDLAGSEGETALTPEFCSTHTQEEVLMRRMEGGVINNGLSAVQSIFRELGKNGKVAKVGKTGIRRILLDYINQNTHISMMFMMSPAHFNSGPTTSTLYFAKSAQLVKIKPKKKKARVNWEAVSKLQQEEIDHLRETCDTIESEIKKKVPSYVCSYVIKEKPQDIAAIAEEKKEEAPKPAPKKKTSSKAKPAPVVTAAPPPTPKKVNSTPEDELSRGEALKKLMQSLDDDVDSNGSKEVVAAPPAHEQALIFDASDERSPEEIMAVDNLEDLSPPEMLTRVQGLEFLLESERSLRQENEKNKDLFIEYLTEGMNSLRKKMRKLARAHELLKQKHVGKKK